MCTDRSSSFVTVVSTVCTGIISETYVMLCRDVLNRSTDECSLDVAGCVILPPPAPVGAPQGVRPAAGHHTGQALKDIDDSMPIYCPNPSDPADCLTVWNGSLSGSSSSTDEGQGQSTRSPPKDSQS